MVTRGTAPPVPASRSTASAATRSVRAPTARFGNQAVLRAQAGLRMSAPHDADEARADSTRDAALRADAPRIAAIRPAPPPAAIGEDRLPRTVATAIRGPGDALDPGVLADLEPRFGHSFAHVRVHADDAAARSADSLGAAAYTVGAHIVFGRGEYAPGAPRGRMLLAHELAHVVQQRANGPAIHRQVVAGGEARPAPLELEIVGADATTDEPLAVMADREAAAHGGRVLRVTSLENMIDQLEAATAGGASVGQLNIWYHGAPEIQLVVGEYGIGRAGRRLPASGFSREWLMLDTNRSALQRFRALLACGAHMTWYGCGTATVRATGGLRTAEERARDRMRIDAHPDVYSSAEDALAHGASLAGATFGRVNVQAWADATCATIRSATDLVHLDPASPQPIAIQNGGQWVDSPPRGACGCDAATGRVAGGPPSRAELFASALADTQTAVASGDAYHWHQMVQLLRTGIPRYTEVVSADGTRTFRPLTGTLPAALRDEMAHREGGRRGPLELQYSRLVYDLLALAGRGVVPPSPLPSTPMPAHLFTRVGTGGSWAAVTMRQLAVVNRSDPWHWIVFNDSAIGDTIEFTRSIIEHELDHAADLEVMLRQFEATNPRPSGTPPREYQVPAELDTVRGWTDPWGLYINAFAAFADHQLDPARHFEITLAQERRPGSDRWSAQEREGWFSLAFYNLPPNVPETTPLAGEDQIIAAFAAANVTLKRAVLLRARELVNAALRPDPLARPADVEATRGAARTLVSHFAPIMELLFRGFMPLLPRATVLRMLAAPRATP